MKNIFALAVALLASLTMMAQNPTVSLTAKSSSIADWNKTYDNVKISVQGANLVGKKPCGATVNENAMSLSSADSHWIEISCEDGLSKVVIIGSGNNTGTNDYYAPLCVCASAPFDNTITKIIEVHYTGYNYDCIENEIDLPEGTKSVRLYRRMKVNDAGTEVGSGSNWAPSSGSGNQTYNITYLAVYAGESTPVTDPVTYVALAGPDAGFIGQKASYTATPDVKAKAYKWTVNDVDQNGASSAKFDYTPNAAGTYAIKAYAKNDNNENWVASNTINFVASERTYNLEQVPISATTVWDFTKAGSGSIEWTENTTPKKDKDTVLLANIEGINLNAEFNSQALRFAGQYPIRDSKYCQGPWISFKTTVAGSVKVEFSNTGSKDEARYVAVNGVVNTKVGSKNTTSVTSEDIPVEAGDVVIEGSFDPYNAQYLRIYKITFTSGEIPLSSDATLKSLVYGSESTSVPNFSPNKETYTVELPATYVGGPPSVQFTTNDENATTNISQATSIPGTATIIVTAEDGKTTKTYTVTFTRASAAPKVESATWANIQGTATVDNVNMTITGQVTNGSSLNIEPQFTGKNLDSQDPTGVQNFANGTISYTFTSSTNDKTIYAVTITEALAMSSDATLKSLTYGGTSVPDFAPDKYVYNIELPSGIKTPPTIDAEPNDANATPKITQAQSVPGSGKVVVTAEDGTTTLTYTINYTVKAPVSGLDLHLPEKYEAAELAGGYNTPLTAVGGREYEVYYTARTKDDSYPTFSTMLVNEAKTNGISNSTSATKNQGRDGDKWFEGMVVSTSDCKKATSKDEFTYEEKKIREHRLGASETYQFHVKGFDQFSLWGMDKKLDPKNGDQVWVVKVDGNEQPTDASLYNKDAYTVRRYDLTTGEHLIEISTTCTDDNVCYMGGFSLRLAQEPRTKWLTGNDSTQKVNARSTIKPVTYVTKYNNIPGAETKLEWLGTAVDGIALQKIEGELTDTLILSGTANAPLGEYKYAVVAYYNGVETSRAEGKFYVKYDIKATTSTDRDADQGSDMDEIKCKYYVYDETTDIVFKWVNDVAAPGITTTAKNGIFTISGTPTTVGTYYYYVTVTEGDTIRGRIKVESADLGIDPILYLYKNDLAYEKDYIYTYLKNSGYNLRAKQTKDDLRPAAQYEKYKWVLISEDVDANNPEVFKILRGGSHLPILNMKAFTYAHPIDSLTDEYGGTWGEPDNGSLSENGKSITVLRDDHPIFSKMHKKKGDKIQVLDSIDRKGLMPIAVKKRGSLCLATAWTRNREDYYGDGVLETFLHEIPAGMDGGNTKYICFPIAMNSSMYITSEGKNLLNTVIAYLTSDEASVGRPQLGMTQFKVGDVYGIIEEGIDGKNKITVEIDSLVHPELADLSSIAPEIEVASPYTHTEPAEGQEVNLTYAQYLPINYVVTDYIHRMVYEVTVVYRKPQGIEDVYVSGEWVNIFDIYGRKVVTTNEDIYSMPLPRGMYIVVTENGQTIKIMR